MSKKVALYLEHPKGQGRELLTLVESSLYIGRSKEVDIVLDDMRCNGIHALIERDEEKKQTRLIDLGSHFGTYRNRRKVNEISLKPGDRFQIGSKVICYDFVKRQRNLTDNFLNDENVRKSNEPVKVFEPDQREKNLLQVTHFWGDTPFEMRTFKPGTDISVGAQKAATFNISLPGERHIKKPWKLSELTKGELLLHIPLEASGLIWKKDQVESIDTLRHRGDTGKEFGSDLDVIIEPGDQAYIQLGEMGLKYEFVATPDKVALFSLSSLDKRLLKVGGALLVFWVLFAGLIQLIPDDKKEKTLEDIPEHIRKVVYNAGIEKALKKQKSAIGQIAQTLEGGRARAEEGASKARKSPKKVVAKKKPVKRVVPTKKVAQKPKQVKVDIVSAFKPTSKKTKTSPDALKATTSQSGNTVSALSTKGFARGTSGLGSGGGGQSVGIGALKGQSTGGGMGAGNFGLAPSKGKTIELPEEEEVVILGGLDPDVIAAIIKRYLAQIQYCYEQQLVINPKLQGKVLASFVIKGNGLIGKAEIMQSSLGRPEAERCITEKIMKWKFPKPRGGGSVGVKYPFLFMSNTGNK